MAARVVLKGGRRELASVRLDASTDPVNALRLAWLALAQEGETVTSLEITEEDGSDNGNG